MSFWYYFVVSVTYIMVKLTNITSNDKVTLIKMAYNQIDVILLSRWLALNIHTRTTLKW